MGPASMLVWISSPVLSRKPVFIKITLSLAARMHSFRLIVVLLSSSIIPILTVKGLIFNASSTAVKRSQVNWTSSGPCIFGFTMYTLPALELDRRLFPPRSCLAIHMVNMASKMPSGISFPALSKIAGLVIRWPTFLTNIRLRPVSRNFLPRVSLYSLSVLSCLVSSASPFMKVSFKSPFISPNQFL